MRTHTTFPAALVCAAALTAGCSTEPATDKELERLRSFGPGLQRMAEGLADATESVGDAVCYIGRWVAPRREKKDFARRCPSGRGNRKLDRRGTRR